MKRLWRDYNLLWVLLIIFVATLAIEGALSYREMSNMYRWHGEVLTMGRFWLGFIQQLAGRVAASVLVLIIFTVARAYFIFRGSPVSKDGPDERTDLLKTILAEITGQRRER
jgi:hydrogenase-4 membrane subunit HyfE